MGRMCVLLAVLVTVALEGMAAVAAQDPVVRQIVVHHIKRISFSLTEVLRFGIAC